MKKSAFTEWETPQDFYDALDAEFGFTCDVCARDYNAKHENYFTPDMDGLSQEWVGVCLMNPPYDKSIGLWMKKAYEASQKGATVVCLIQGRSTDTIWWHDYAMRSAEIRYIKDRLHFGKNGKHARANISNIVVIFTPFCSGPPSACAINTKGQHIIENEPVTYSVSKILDTARTPVLK
jgi:phage N-6-adenine-methyltransferase